ncbi:hypothetical protein ASE00_10225 [Sphingomonas sp. Root710]|nr:hypothetical protein ASE00_10225 [Sphingomonas sp. Root710]
MREILVDHAVSLDGIFTDFTDHAVDVFQDSPFASQTYLRLAMRAQTGCRAALQAVVRADQAVEAAAAKEARKAAASGLDAAIAPPAGKPARRNRSAATH